jgi:hypothetical protein
VFKSADVVDSFRTATVAHGLPASLLTDNAVFAGAPLRGGRVALEVELVLQGIRCTHSRHYHPQTCGKVERFHQTIKRRLTSRTTPWRRGSSICGCGRSRAWSGEQ